MKITVAFLEKLSRPHIHVGVYIKGPVPDDASANTASEINWPGDWESSDNDSPEGEPPGPSETHPQHEDDVRLFQSFKRTFLETNPHSGQA